MAWTTCSSYPVADMRQAQWPRAPSGRLEVRHTPCVCCPQAGEGLPRTPQTLGAWTHIPQPGGAGRPLGLLCPPKRARPCFPSWAQKHKSWRFQKTRQTWLLLHMYDHDKVPDEHFSTLLAYLEGLKGRARELTVQKAEALMQQLDGVGDSTDPLLLEKSQRVRHVLQLLS